MQPTDPVKRTLTIVFVALVALAVLWLGIDPESIPWPN